MQVGTKENPVDGQAAIPVFKSRMKSPLVRLRIGELFGTGEVGRDGTMGYISSLTYEWPDNSPWEFRKGQRVPKFIDVQVEYQIIHDDVPEMNTREFFGYYPSLVDQHLTSTTTANPTDTSAPDEQLEEQVLA